MNPILRITALILFTLCSSFAGAACTPPAFEELTLKQQPLKNPDNETIELQMGPVASIRLPAGFSRLGVLPDGGFVFGNHPKGIKGGLGFETKETVAVHAKNTSAADFFRAMFRGLNEDGCRYLAGQNLEARDYRIHVRLSEDSEIFAFGTGGEHHFYVIRSDKPNLVLNGLLKGVSRSEFETILSTVQPL